MIMTEKRNTILLCMSDASLRMLLRDLLHEQGYDVLCTDSAQECTETACTKAPDLCVTDSLPEMSGTTLVRELRARNVAAPIILMSDRTSKEDILAGYASGCDDYMPKPFSFDILLCRIRALLQLVHRSMHEDIYVFDLGGVTFDANKQTLGTRTLSSKENDLLLLLCRNMNKLVDRTVILKNIWLTDDCFAANSMAVYVHRLRKYLEPIEGVRIAGVHGKGIKLIYDSTATD